MSQLTSSLGYRYWIKATAETGVESFCPISEIVYIGGHSSKISCHPRFRSVKSTPCPFRFDNPCPRIRINCSTRLNPKNRIEVVANNWNFYQKWLKLSTYYLSMMIFFNLISHNKRKNVFHGYNSNGGKNCYFLRINHKRLIDESTRKSHFHFTRIGLSSETKYHNTVMPEKSPLSCWPRAVSVQVGYVESREDHGAYLSSNQSGFVYIKSRDPVSMSFFTDFFRYMQKWNFM